MSRAIKRTVALVAVGAMSATLAACGSGGSGSSSAPDSITVGFVGALTGPLAASGKDSLVGLEAGARYAKQKYGITVKIQKRDTKGEPTSAVAATRDLAQKGVTAMYFTTEAFPAVQNVLNQVKVPGGTAGGISAVLSDVGDSHRYKYAFSTGAGISGDTSIKPLLQWAQQLGGKVGMLSVDSAYGTAQQQLTTQLAKSDFPGLDLVSQTFPDTATDVTAQLRKLQQADVKSVIIWGYGASLVAVLNSFGKLGWNPPAANGGIGAGEPSTMALIPAGMKDTFLGGPMPKSFLSQQSGAKPSGATATFERFYLAQEGGSDFNALDQVGAIAFDWALLVAEAVKANKSSDAAKVKKVLTSGKSFNGANGNYKFGPNTRVGIGADQLQLFYVGKSCSSGLCEAYTGQ